MNLLKALATVSSMTLVSRIMGFVRDTIVARAFGAGAFTDAFFVAFKIPNLLRRMFAEGAFSQAFVPVLGEVKERRGAEATHVLVNHVATILGLVLIAVTVLGMLAAPFVVYISAPGFHTAPDKFELTVKLLRIIFPYIFFISLVALAAGVLNTFRRFSVPAFTPVLLNLAMIASALWLAPYCNPPVLALAWGVLIGGALQLAFQLPFLRQVGCLPKFDFNWHDPDVQRIFKLMLPALFGVSIGQISLLINTIFASFLETGSVSWLYYADRLMEFPSGMLGVALGTILLPSLSKHYADKSTVEYSRLLDWGLRMTLILALPSAVALAVLAVPLLSTLFQYGQFTMHDVLMSRNALVAYSVGLLGLIMVKVLAPGFYARQNIKTPVKIALITLVATQLMNLVFIGPFKHAGLALAIGLGACVNAGLLYYKLRRHQVYQPQPGWLSFMFKVGLAVAVMGWVLWLGAGAESEWLHSHFRARLLHLAWLIPAGSAAYFASLFVLGFRPAHFARREA